MIDTKIEICHFQLKNQNSYKYVHIYIYKHLETPLHHHSNNRNCITSSKEKKVVTKLKISNILPFAATFGIGGVCP